MARSDRAFCRWLCWSPANGLGRVKTGPQAPEGAWSLPVPREMSKCLQLAWRGTLLQVPEVLLRFSCGVERCKPGVGWGLRWMLRAVTGRFRTEVYGPCCCHLSRSPAPARDGLLNAHGMSHWDRGRGS